MGASHTGDTEGVGVEDSENPLLRVVEGVGVGVWVADSVAVVLGVVELEKVCPVDMEGVGDRVGVVEADGGWPQMRTLSKDRKTLAEPVATAVMRQQREAIPCAAAGSTGVIRPGYAVPRGVSGMTAPAAVKGPAVPAVE